MRTADASAPGHGRCVVVEGRAVVRDGLVMALRAHGHDVVGVAAVHDLHGSTAPPAVIVVDGARLGVPMDRIREHVLAGSSDVRVLVVSDHVDDGVEHGLELVERSLGAGGIASALSDPVAGREPGRRRADPLLTPAERSVLRLIAQGLTAREAGASLGISPRTVEKHKRCIFARLGAATQAQAVYLAIRGGELSHLENAS